MPVEVIRQLEEMKHASVVYVLSNIETGRCSVSAYHIALDYITSKSANLLSREKQ